MRDYFRSLAKDTTGYNTTNTDRETDAKQVKVLQLINAFRFCGHQHYNLDPAYHNLTEADFQETFNVGSFAIGKETMKLNDLYAALKQTYCGSIGAEYMHIIDTEEKLWLQQCIESVVGHASFTRDEKAVS